MGFTRVVPMTVCVGDKEVLLTAIEEYAPGSNLGVPILVRIGGPNGLTTKGTYPEVWNEMLELLGVRKAVSTEDSALNQDQSPASSGQDAAVGQAESAPSNQQPVPCQSDRTETAIVEEASAPAAFSPPTAIQDQNHIQNPSAAWEGPVIQAADEFEDDMKLAEDTEGREDEDSEKDSGLNQNVLRDSMLRLLNQKIYSEDPPLKIDKKMVAFIRHLSSTQEAANLIRHIEENIQLAEMQGNAARRAANLTYLKKANGAKRCGHVKLNGQSCGSPALRGEQYCHFHAEAHGASINLPLIEDERSLQLAYMKLGQQVAAGKIDPAQARILLQVLDKAGRTIPKSESLVERRFPGI